MWRYRKVNGGTNLKLSREILNYIGAHIIYLFYVIFIKQYSLFKKKNKQTRKKMNKPWNMHFVQPCMHGFCLNCFWLKLSPITEACVWGTQMQMWLWAFNAPGQGGSGGVSSWHNSNYTASKLLTVKFWYFSHRLNETRKAIFLAGVKEPTQGNLPLRKPEGAKQ